MNNSKNKKNGSRNFALALISVFEKILGLAKNLLFSFLYGTSNISDAFNITLTIPDTFYSIFGSGINSSYIPLYTSRQDEENKKKFTSETVTMLLIITSAISLLGMIFSKYIVYAFAPGFDAETSKLTTNLVAISVWSIVFLAISNLLISYLHIHESFVISGITPVVLNILQCVGIFISAFCGYYWLSVGILAGTIVQLIVLIILSSKQGYNLSLSMPNRVTVSQIMLIAIPIILSASANRINLLIDKAVASYVIEGGVSALAYADSLILFIKSVFGTVFITTIFPYIAMAVGKKDRKETDGFVSSTIERMMFFIVPITVGCMIIAEEIVSIIYKRGAFSAQSVLLTSECLRWYAIGLPAFCIRDLLVKVFYANKDSKTPTYNMFIGIGINVILNFVLAYFFGLKGLAMASSIAAYVIMLLLAINASKKGFFGMDSTTLAKLVKITASSSLMLVCIYFVKAHLAALPIVASVSLMVAVGLMTYCIFLLLFKTYTPKMLLKRIIMK